MNSRRKKYCWALLFLVLASVIVAYFWVGRKRSFSYGRIESATLYDVDPLKHEWSYDLGKRTKYVLSREEIDKLFACCEKSSRSRIAYKGGPLMTLKLSNGREADMAVSYYGEFALLRGGGTIYFCGSSKHELRRFLEGVLRDRFLPNR